MANPTDDFSGVSPGLGDMVTAVETGNIASIAESYSALRSVPVNEWTLYAIIGTTIFFRIGTFFKPHNEGLAEINKQKQHLKIRAQELDLEERQLQIRAKYKEPL